MRSDYGILVFSSPTAERRPRTAFFPGEKVSPFTFFSDSQGINQSSGRVLQGAAGILPADLTLPENGAIPEGFCTIRTAGPIIQFDLPAGCQKHFSPVLIPAFSRGERVMRGRRSAEVRAADFL
jgi:hypothetical protein